MTPENARAIARAVIGSGAGSTPRPFDALLAGEQAVLRARAAEAGLDVETYYATQIAELAVRQAEQRAAAAETDAIERGIR